MLMRLVAVLILVTLVAFPIACIASVELPASLEYNVDGANKNVSSSCFSLFSSVQVEIRVPSSGARLMGRHIPIQPQVTIFGDEISLDARQILKNLCRLVISDSQDWNVGKSVMYSLTDGSEQIAFPSFYSDGLPHCSNHEAAGGGGQLCYYHTAYPGPRMLWASVACADPAAAEVEEGSSYPSAPFQTFAQATVSYFATHTANPPTTFYLDPSLTSIGFHVQDNAAAALGENLDEPPICTIDWTSTPHKQAEAYCQDLDRGQPCVGFVAKVLEVRHEERYHAWVAALHDYLLSKIGNSLVALEGNTYSIPAKTRAMRKAMDEKGDHLRLICEIGFNAGHSALLWLLNRPSSATRVLAFDIGHHNYTSHAVAFLHQHFGGKSLELVIGSSLDTVPAYAEAHPETACDILLIDGAHHEGIPMKDIENMMLLANRSSHVLLMDDSDMDDVASAVKTMISRGQLQIEETVHGLGFDTIIQIETHSGLEWQGPAQLQRANYDSYVDIGRYIWLSDNVACRQQQQQQQANQGLHDVKLGRIDQGLQPFQRKMADSGFSSSFSRFWQYMLQDK